LGQILRQELQRDEATKLGVLGLVNDTHTTSAEFLNNAVVGDCLVDEGLGFRHAAVILGREREGCQRLYGRRKLMVQGPHRDGLARYVVTANLRTDADVRFQ
jgi:hypothetical protein